MLVASLVERGWSYGDLDRLTESQMWLFGRAHVHMARLREQAAEDRRNGVTRSRM